MIPVPLQYGVSQGRSAVFATAQTNQTAASLAEFMLTRVSDYSVATIDNHTLEATQDDAEAFSLYRKDALAGDAEAQLKLGEMYEAGRGVASLLKLDEAMPASTRPTKSHPRFGATAIST